MRIEHVNNRIRLSDNEFHTVNLSQYLFCDGISYDNLKSDGDFDGWGATYPAEELPESNTLISLNSIPFIFPSKEQGDVNNFVLNGQVIPICRGYYSRLYILGAVTGKNGENMQEDITISYLDGTYETITVGLSNWLQRPVYNESVGFMCTHVHYPDVGQKTVTNMRIMVEPVQYKIVNEITEHESIKNENDQNLFEGKNTWKPKIWFQYHGLRCDKPITAITFLKNPKYHVFAITLEYKR